MADATADDHQGGPPTGLVLFLGVVLGIVVTASLVLGGLAVAFYADLDQGAPDATERAGTTASGGVAVEASAGRTASGDAVFIDDFDDGSLDGWTVETTNGAGGTVDDGRLRLRVRKCNTATATRPIGDVDGPVTVSFDWAVMAERWWEHTTVRLVDADGQPVEYDVVTGEDVPYPDRSSRKRGSAVLRTDADGRLGLQFRVTPSNHCSNGDHANTYLWVDDVRVTAGS